MATENTYRAEKKANEWFIEMFKKRGQLINPPNRVDAYIEGYHQAEKDLEEEYEEKKHILMKKCVNKAHEAGVKTGKMIAESKVIHELALSWEDIKRIDHIISEVGKWKLDKELSEQECYEEVLRRFNEENKKGDENKKDA